MNPRYEPAHTRYPVWPWMIALLAVAGTVWGVSEWDARINHAHKELALAKSELASFDMLYGDGNPGADPQ